MSKQGYHSKICSAAAVYTAIRAIPSICFEIEQKWPYLPDQRFTSVHPV